MLSAARGGYGRDADSRRDSACLVSNSLSGGDRELDEASAVGDPTHMVEIGRGQRVSTGEGQRRVALQ
jgi:hypothetical protein